MEKLQGPINPCLIGEDLEVGWLEEFISNNSGNLNFEVPYNTEDGNFGEQDYNFPNLEDKMPFLQMLQSVEPSFHHQQQHFQQQQQLQQDATFPALMQLEPNLQLLLRLQQQKVAYYTSPSEVTNNNNNNNNIVDNNMIIMDDLHSTEVKSESEVHQVVESVEQQQPDKCNSNSKSVGVRRSSNNNNKRRTQLVKSCATTTTQYVPMKKTSATVAGVSTTSVVVGQREKKKRKRSIRPAKNKEEVETQRMTHIAVERNRRRQMNEHLNALRSLMPPSYVQRGDQASIIGGAIDFVKELEQMLQSLEAQKKMKQYEENGDVSLSTSSTSSSSNLHLGNFFTPFQSRNSLHYSQDQMNGNEVEGVNVIRKNNNNNNNNEEFSAEKRSALADIEVVVIQNHVNLKIQCQRRPGQLLKAIVAFEELRLTVLHLNITSLHTLVHYSFNLKIEDECKLGTADEVARAVHQIFSLIHMS